MKQLLALFLIVLTTCAKIEDDVVLEKGFSFPKIRMPRMTRMPSPKITQPKVTRTIRLPKVTRTIGLPKVTRTTRLPKVTRTTRLPKITRTTRLPKITTRRFPKITTRTTRRTTKPPKITTRTTRRTTKPPKNPKKLKLKLPKIKSPKQTLKDLVKIPEKGLKGLFKGKIGKAFEKLKNVVQKGVSWLKKNNLWDPIVNLAKNLGKQFGNELCQKALPDEVCGSILDFALGNDLGSDDYTPDPQYGYDFIEKEPEEEVQEQEEEEEEEEK